LLVLLSALIVAAAVGWAGLRIAREVGSRRGDVNRGEVAPLIEIFSKGIEAVAADPKALLVWQPLATMARKVFPAEFAALDEASGVTFPFSPDQMQAAHARWTTDWLGWERTHDAECKMKSAAVEHELGDRTSSPYGRARLEAVEREKLEQYQRRYEEYTRVSRGLQLLMKPAPPSR
jgi:hypothetical protein